MKAPLAAAVLSVVFGARAHAKPPPARTQAHLAKPPVHVDVRPAPPLPMLPSVARVRVEVSRGHVVVVEAVNLPRGDWQSGGLDLYVAFGAPGTPEAIDARLASSSHDTTDPHRDDPGQPVAVEPAIQRLPNAQLLLGRPQMAGVVLHVKEADLRHAYEGGGSAELRVRSLLTLPVADARGARDVVVRLGIAGEAPLTLGHVQVVSLEGPGYVERAEARLCGPEAVALPMTVAILPKDDGPSAGSRASIRDPLQAPPIAPVTAVRHASDDLCVRWWAMPPAPLKDPTTTSRVRAPHRPRGPS